MSSQYDYTATTTPLAVPHKPSASYTYSYPYQPAYDRLSESPPEPAASSTGSGVASYGHTGASTYASSDYASDGASGIDLLEYMNDRLAATYNPIPLDKSLAKQAQASGELNAKTRQLLELQALAQQKLLEAQANFGVGIKAAKEVQRDLKWSQKKVDAMNKRAAQKYAAEYALASQRYPAPAGY